MIGYIISYKILTHDVVEIKIDIEQKLSYLAGQWVLINFQTSEKPLKRAYSITNYKQTTLGIEITLAIKLNEHSQSSGHLRALNIGDSLEIIGIFGKFVLQQTTQPKIFIGTGTGIVPLLAMAESTKTAKQLYFSVPTYKDLFYFDRIQNIPSLDYHIFLSREQKPGFEIGRIPIANLNFQENSEFYICGNPEVVNNFTQILKNKGHSFIYTEQY